MQIFFFSDSYWQYQGGEVWRGGNEKLAIHSPAKRADLALGVRLPFLRFAPLQVAVVELQRFHHKIRFLPSGD